MSLISAQAVPPGGRPHAQPPRKGDGAVDTVYRQGAMIGDLTRTRAGWAIEPPTECQNGHLLGPGQVLVGHQPCTCRASHIGWTCLKCDATVYWPPVDPGCSVLVGAARVR
jgi:hypothetical protein